MYEEVDPEELKDICREIFSICASVNINKDFKLWFDRNYKFTNSCLKVGDHRINSTNFTLTMDDKIRIIASVEAGKITLRIFILDVVFDNEKTSIHVLGGNDAWLHHGPWEKSVLDFLNCVLTDIAIEADEVIERACHANIAHEREVQDRAARLEQALLDRYNEK